MKPPQRQIRAVFDDNTVTVYQAYSAAIAVPAVVSNSFAGTPFKRDRMTWIKPSFLWMMYRSGWGTKAGQEHILAVQITRAGFEEALSMACLSHFDREVYTDQAEWIQLKRTSPVVVQWDPERTVTGEPLPWRSIQIGLSGTAAEHYVDRWVLRIADITDDVLRMRQALSEFPGLMSSEHPYPLPQSVALAIGASTA